MSGVEYRWDGLIISIGVLMVGNVGNGMDIQDASSAIWMGWIGVLGSISLIIYSFWKMD
jgi:hypothetical protein